MVSLLRIVIVLALLIVVGGVILLATVDMKPPAQRIEKIVPNDRLQR